MRRSAGTLLCTGVAVGMISLLFGCMASMPGRSHRGPLPALSADEILLRDNLRGHITALATAIGERNMRHYAELEQAARYITNAFQQIGYTTRDYAYALEGTSPRNIEAELPGSDPGAGVIVVGGHYDSALGTPGANDNASGVAATIELARLLKAAGPFLHTVRFVAFVNEEPPYFFTSDMGSRVYASQLHRDQVNVAAMFSLETIGCYTNARNTQHYPRPLSLFYPDTGNFIGFVGNMTSRALVRRSVKTFRATTPFPSEGAALPSFIPGVGWSDHSSFWKEGFPAVEVTDTAPFRYPHYHTPEDTVEKIQYDRMAQVVMGLYRVVSAAAGASR